MAAAVGLAIGLAEPARAGERFLLEGIVDLEAFVTDGSSVTLSRNGGNPATVGRVQAWAAVQLTAGLQAYAQVEAESDNSSGARESEAELEQLGLRWTHAGRHFVAVDAGRILTPFGAVLARNLSTRNPLIGQPGSVYAGYPVGVKWSGSVSWFDYYAALVDQPAIRDNYLPREPGSAFRPDLGLGISLAAGLRIGLSWTLGPYLGRFAEPALPAAQGWKDYEQRLYGVDFQYSRGYFEASGMLARSAYDVPGGPVQYQGTSYLVELKYTWTPRLFGAIRNERNAYPFLRLLEGSRWLYRDSVVHGLEVGLGYRLTPDLLFKLAYRHDDLSVAGAAAPFPGGWSAGAQLSWGFDLLRMTGRGY